MPTPLLPAAFALADELHAGQTRKGGSIPYLSHLLAVAALGLEHGGDEETAAAALLHDAVEDQGGLPTLERIRVAFGERVAGLVRACSDSWTTPKPPWRKRKEDYLRELASAPPAARLISASDKLHNARTLLSDYRRRGEALWGLFKGGREGTLWYYRALIAEYLARGPAELAEELRRVVEELERLVSGRGGLPN